MFPIGLGCYPDGGGCLDQAPTVSDYGVGSTGAEASGRHLPDVAHDKAEPVFRPLNKLSTGQQCTAILLMLLLDNSDPLLMDQPEDNLDNAFIAEWIVTELRNAKSSRQFLFATHNANIPVFGDAEWM